MTQSGISNALSLVAGFAVLAVFVVVLFKPFYKIIDTPHFAITSLLTIATGTALGTFVTQSVPYDVFTQRYGETGSTLLRFLQLDDLFHSWWYVALFATMGLSLVKISLKKKLSRENTGFHLAHLSPLIILFGFWADYFYGFQGMIQLEEGQTKNIVKLYDSRTNLLIDSTELPFSLRLDKFEFERHDPDYRLQVWRQDTTGHSEEVSHSGGAMNEKPPQIVASMPAEKMVIRHIYGTDIYFRMADLFPNFEFKYSYPMVIDTIEAKDPGIQMDVKMPDGENATLQLRTSKSGRNKLVDLETFGASLEFYWDLPDDVTAALAKPSKSDTSRIIFAGKGRQIHYLINGQLKTEALEVERYYPVPGKDNIGFTIQFLFPDAAYISAVPSTKDDRLVNPVARVETWHKGGYSQESFLYPSLFERKPGTFQIAGTPYFLAFESMKDREAKFYKSDLSVVNAGGEVIKQQTIKVNEPMLHGGYRFYQSDYDPNNPSYSGIGVTHDPGLYLIYAGFFVLVAGVALMFYGKYAKGGTKGKNWGTGS